MGMLFHCMKSVQIRNFSAPYFPAFRLNTERYSISLRIQSKCGKIRTRKNSVFGHFSPVQANVLRRISPYNFNKRDSTRNIFGNMSRLFFGTAISQKSFERLLVRNLYLSSYLKNYCCGRALKWQVSKFAGGNTVNSFRTLAESHKRLKLTEEFAQS